MKLNKLKFIALGLVALAPSLNAAGTSAGTVISTKAIVSFEVSGTPQTDAESADVSFIVDRKIDFDITNDDGASVVANAGASDNVLTFTLTNTGNATQNFQLTASEENGLTFDPGDGSATDNADATTVEVFVEDGTTLGYTSGEDADQHIYELAADTSVTVYIVATMPATTDPTAVAMYTLLAEAADPDSSTITVTTETIGAEDPTVEDIVFADANGDDDIAGDGKFSRTGVYNIVSSSLDVTKSFLVNNDPQNGSTNPKAIPGALIIYTVRIENTGNVEATNVYLTDIIETGMTYDTNNAVSVTVITDTSGNAATNLADLVSTGTGPLQQTTEIESTYHNSYSGPENGNVAGPAVRVLFPSIEIGDAYQVSYGVLVD